MVLNNQPKKEKGGRGEYVNNIVAILDEVSAKGLSDADILKFAKIAPSTLAKWRRDNAADKRFVNEFIERLKAIETPKTIDQQSTQKSEQSLEIEHFFETAKRIGIENVTISTERLKEILLNGIKL